MSNLSQNQSPIRCVKCGAELPAQLPAGLCPKCLLEAGLETQPQKGPQDTVVMPTPPALKGIPQPGEVFGHYRLVRLLGQGGMGVVFEAEDLETGRRVALKILSQALDSPEARKRFLREGQIAASINHPNSVYVFGTEEIAGTPVIAMELVGGGTLRDRVVASGPLSASEAVDMLLQLIAGLEAAQQAGVLHRDIKPSNCFVDPDGTVKIGDFGLSITTAVRTESNVTGPASLLGTPAFSSPEQLRGEELTVRSDLYSVGVTLYYLLTGRMPFEAPNLVQLLVTVLEKQPPSPARLRPGIPEGLARAVLRCLQKDSSARFESYAALRRALQPYASFSPTPATLALRFGAYVFDLFLLNLPGWFIFSLFFGGFTNSTLASLGKGQQVLYSVFFYLLVVAYFGLFEGLRGASPGKALCRLRVVGLDGKMPEMRRGLLRAALFSGFASLPAMGLTLFGVDLMMKHPGSFFLWFIPTVIQLLVFCTCRRQNGFAALHDLWSGTRVLARPIQPVRPGSSLVVEAPPATGELVQIGPYHVLAELGRSDDATVVLGYDARLLRKVWLRRVPAATPPVAMALRHLARPGRFRWLNGRRAGDDSWDAYEASAGQPLLHLISSKQDWEKVRFWLLDLAAELKAGQKDGSFPLVLCLDRVWITADGRAKLLDFPAPGINRNRRGKEAEFSEPIASKEIAKSGPPPDDLGGYEGQAEQCSALQSLNAQPSTLNVETSPRDFLRQMALSALTGQPMSLEQSRTATLDLPLPLHARGFLQRLATEADLSQIWTQLQSLIGKAAAVSRRRRWAMLAIALGFPVFMAVAQLAGTFLISKQGTAEIIALQNCLIQCQPLEVVGTNAPVQPPKAEKKRQQFEIYIAGRFRPLITNSVQWDGVMAKAIILPPQKVLAERIIATHPKITPEELTEAKTAVESQFPIIPPAAEQEAAFLPQMSWILPMMLYAGTLIFVVLPCFAAALLFRGGLAMRILGMAVVGRNGRPSRLRTFWRNFIAWLPFLCSPMLVKAAGHFTGPLWSVLVAAGVLALLTLFSLALRRSLQDRLAGTWLVPNGETWETGTVADGKSHTRFPWLPLTVGAGVLALLFALTLLVQFASNYVNTHKPATNPEASSVANSSVATPCVVLQSEGIPATNARVWVGTEKDPSLSNFQPGNYYPRGLQKIQADAAGAFTLPGVPDDTLVIVTHPAGVLTTTAANMRQAVRVRLQPFGQVEGLLLSEGKPKAGANINMDLLQSQRGLSVSRGAVTGADGRFLITNLVAGEYRLYREFLPHRHIEGGFAVHPSHQKIVSVKPGETLNVQWGGDGRSVIGQALSENPAIAVDWLNDSHSLELVRSSAATSLTEFVRDSYGMGKSSAEELQEVRAARSYHLEFEEDGSFRAEDVPPGKYELRIRVTKPEPVGPNHIRLEGEELGSLVQTVTIPAGREPDDLGTKIVPVKGEPNVALTQPLEANLTTIESKSLPLASLRGRFVVLVFWAGWSESSKQTLAGLGRLQAGFTSDAGKLAGEPPALLRGVEFVAASLDDDADSLRQAAASANYGFTLTRLAMDERVAAIETFKVTTLPAVLLLGPDGRLIARDLATARLQAILMSKLKPGGAAPKAFGAAGLPSVPLSDGTDVKSSSDTRTPGAPVSDPARFSSNAISTDWRLAGVVIADDGQPIMGAKLQPNGIAYSNGSTTWGQIGGESPISDAQGRFVLHRQSKFEQIYVMVSARGAAARPFQLQPGRDYVLRLHEGVQVTGRLVAAGQPVPGAKVRVRPANSHNGEYFESDQITTDSNGRFSIPNLPAEQELVLVGNMASLQGKGTLPPKPFTSGKNHTKTDLGDLRLQPGYRVSGQIVLTDGKPLPEGARLLVAQAGDYAEIKLDATGRFAFLSVPGQEVSVSARFKGYKFSRRNPSLDWLNDQILGKVNGDLTNLTLVMDPGAFHYNSNHEGIPEGVEVQPHDQPLRGVKL